ncbi:MAG: hypothetical protein ABGX22_05150, partial [Pirellulaceae bacterium]
CFFSLFLLVVSSAVSVAGVMLVVRRWIARLERGPTAEISVIADGLQFFIRHLVVLTLVVSFTLAIGRWLQPYFQYADRLTFF